MSHRKRIPALTLGVVRQVKDVRGIDLLRMSDPEVAQSFWDDPVAVGLAIAIAGGPEELEGDALEDAKNELAQRIVEFFPQRSIYDDFISESDKTAQGGVDPWRVVFRAAGMAGLPPWDYSFAEIVWAAQGAYEPFADLLAFQVASSGAKGQLPDADTLNRWHPKRPRPKRKRNAQPSTS